MLIFHLTPPKPCNYTHKPKKMFTDISLRTSCQLMSWMKKINWCEQSLYATNKIKLPRIKSDQISKNK